jgi:hypothetical protein
LNEVPQMHCILLSIHLAAASHGLRLGLTFKRRYQSCAHIHCQNVSTNELGVAQYCHTTGQTQVKLHSRKAEECTQVDHITGFTDFRDGVGDFNPKIPVPISRHEPSYRAQGLVYSVCWKKKDNDLCAISVVSKRTVQKSSLYTKRIVLEFRSQRSL